MQKSRPATIAVNSRTVASRPPRDSRRHPLFCIILRNSLSLSFSLDHLSHDRPLVAVSCHGFDIVRRHCVARCVTNAPLSPAEAMVVSSSIASVAGGNPHTRANDPNSSDPICATRRCKSATV